MDKKLGLLTIERYANAQAEALLERLAWQVRHTAKRCDPEAVHDLRVVIRQFMNCLRIFKRFFPPRPRQKIRRQLRVMRNLAGEVRNRDISLEILVSVLSPPDEKLSTQLTNERERAKGELVKALHRWTRRNLFRKWRVTLGL
jgi:CHAD domain-containing protein